MRLSLCFVALVVLVGCARAPVICGTEDNNLNEGYEAVLKTYNARARNCFMENFQDCRPAELQITRYSQEGGPFIYTLNIQELKGTGGGQHCYVKMHLDASHMWALGKNIDDQCKQIDWADVAIGGTYNWTTNVVDDPKYQQRFNLSSCSNAEQGYVM